MPIGGRCPHTRPQIGVGDGLEARQKVQDRTPGFRIGDDLASALRECGPPGVALQDGRHHLGDPQPRCPSAAAISSSGRVFWNCSSSAYNRSRRRASRSHWSCCAPGSLTSLRPTNAIYHHFLMSSRIADTGELFGELPQLSHIGVAARQPGDINESDSTSDRFVEAARSVASWRPAPPVTPRRRGWA